MMDNKLLAVDKSLIYKFMIIVFISTLLSSCNTVAAHRRAVVNDLIKSKNIRIIVTYGTEESFYLKEINNIVIMFCNKILTTMGYSVVSEDSVNYDFTIKINYELEPRGYYAQKIIGKERVGEPFFQVTSYIFNCKVYFLSRNDPEKPLINRRSQKYERYKDQLSSVAIDVIGTGLVISCTAFAGEAVLQPLLNSSDPDVQNAALRVKRIRDHYR